MGDFAVFSKATTILKKRNQYLSSPSTEPLCAHALARSLVWPHHCEDIMIHSVNLAAEDKLPEHATLGT